MNKKLFALKLLIIVWMVIFWWFMYSKLPEMIPTHWNIQWVADDFWPKKVSLFMIPVITFFMLLMFQVLPKFDPKKENYPKFEKAYEAFQFAIIWFFAYLYVFTTFAAIYNLDINKFIFIWMWALFAILWNYMWKIRRNYFVWIRLPWTLEDDEIWNKTHRFWGKAFILSGIVLILSWIFSFNFPILVLISIFGSIFVTMIYSYLEFRKAKKV